MMPNRATIIQRRIEESVQSLRKSYVHDVAATLRRLKTELAKGDRKTADSELHELSDALHKIRGSAGSYDLNEIGQAATEMEELLIDNKLSSDRKQLANRLDLFLGLVDAILSKQPQSDSSTN